MALDTKSSPLSGPSSPSRGPPTPLSLDLSSLPPLITPRSPSNTLLVTNLNDLAIFRPDHLQSIRTLIDQTAPILSWSPLKSFRRIIVSFYDVDSAIRIRQMLDGEAIMGERVRVYFGEPTPIRPVDQHLHAPESQKLFFISPPPSPPHGWEVKNEGPPNKQVHADDLAAALAKLRARPQQDPLTPSSAYDGSGSYDQGDGMNRQRSGSMTMIYDPEEHGDSSSLPAISVEDLTGSPDERSPVDIAPFAKPMAHTARPPVELMADV